jgi:hypothetical protein
MEANFSNQGLLALLDLCKLQRGQGREPTSL